MKIVRIVRHMKTDALQNATFGNVKIHCVEQNGKADEKKNNKE